MQKEIEVKAKVSSFQDVRKQLEQLGCIFSDTVRQEDDIFVDFEGDFTQLKLGVNFLRIRTEHKAGNTRILFTLKQPQTNELDCIEKETEIADARQLEDTLVLMGYHKAISVYKNRTKTKYKDMEICLDEVDHLGSFIEVEKITEGDGDAVQEELFNFLETLGVKREDRVINGYDTLMYRHNNN
jgi:adenylate cyclase class 2